MDALDAAVVGIIRAGFDPRDITIRNVGHVLPEGQVGQFMGVIAQ